MTASMLIVLLTTIIWNKILKIKTKELKIILKIKTIGATVIAVNVLQV